MNYGQEDCITGKMIKPFSVCGKQKGFKDDRGNLFFKIMRAVDSKKPKIIFLENVASHIKCQLFILVSK